MPELVDDLCEFMHRDDVSPVAQAAIAHAQFETIHPFGDGNGRMGRCLIHTLLRRRGVAPTYVPPLSLVLATDKNAYVAGLEDFRLDEVDRWVAQFAEAVEDSAEIALNLPRRLAEPKAEWVARAEPMRADSTARAILDQLPSFPIITAAIAAELAGRSRVAAKRPRPSGSGRHSHPPPQSEEGRQLGGEGGLGDPQRFRDELSRRNHPERLTRDSQNALFIS